MTPQRPFRILGICGSLRPDSYNRKVLRAAAELAPDGVVIDIHEGLGEIPPFDETRPTPAAVTRLKDAVRACDAVLFATPEYNHSVPGVLKNAIDWVSYPIPDNAWAGKPVAILGASLGALGTARAQYHLRQTLVFVDMHAVNKPEIVIGQAATKFSPTGHLQDETACQLIEQLLQNLQQLASRYA